GRRLLFGELSLQFRDPLVLSLERFDQGGYTDGQDDTSQPEESRPFGLTYRGATHEQDTTNSQNENREQQQPPPLFPTHPPSFASSRRTIGYAAVGATWHGRLPHIPAQLPHIPRQHNLARRLCRRRRPPRLRPLLPNLPCHRKILIEYLICTNIT